MPHEGCQQNRSAVHWMPVPLGHFQPGTSCAPREPWSVTELARGLGSETTQACFPKTCLRLVCSMRAKNLPLRLYSKTGSENEGMPHEGCRQNRSAVSQTPIPLSYFQP